MSRCGTLSSAKAASTNARRGLLVALGEVVRIGRWVELRSDPLCLGQMLNRNDSGFVRQIERHLRDLEALFEKHYFNAVPVAAARRPA